MDPPKAFMGLFPSDIPVFAICVLLVYTLYGVIYRLFLSPLAKVPGPRLAALTEWYEFYYDVIKRGRYTWRIAEMHEKYGPIVRITPWAVHINDPNFIDEIYTGGGRKVDKPPRYAAMFGISAAAFATDLHEKHRVRRGLINSFFSKRSIAKLEPVIQSTVDRLCNRLESFRKSGEPLNLRYAYMALGTDVINQYCFAAPKYYLDEDDFHAALYHSLIEASQMSASKVIALHFDMSSDIDTDRFPNVSVAVSNRQFVSGISFTIHIKGGTLRLQKQWFTKATNPSTYRILEMLNEREAQIQELMDAGEEARNKTEHATIFHFLLEEQVPPAERTLFRLGQEAISLIGAGGITTQHTLKTLTYHILTNPPVLAKLKAELKDAMPDPNVPAPLQQLEHLPYLSAVISEGFRVSYGIAHRMERSFPDRAVKYGDYIIPPNTSVSMTTMLIHNNPSIFPDPQSFIPERWLDTIQDSIPNIADTTPVNDNKLSLEKPLQQQRLDKYLLTFSRGSRICVGMNLAYAELYLVLASIFRKFELELFDVVKERDVDILHDFFNPSEALDSAGLRAKVVGRVA